MNKIILFFAISLFSLSALADWEIETFTHDAEETTQSQSAMVRNEEGFELAIFMSNEGYIWMDFSLSDYSFDEMSQNELPKFQIDDQKPVQMLRGFVATIIPADEGINAVIVGSDEKISTEKDFSVDHIIAERLPERVICPIWQGKLRPHLNTVEALTHGEKIHFDYVFLDGTKGTTTFTLKGAKHAIESVISK